MTFPGTTQVPIQFMGGLNSKMSEFALEQPFFQSLENVAFNKIGQLDKRSGFTAISNNKQGGGTIDTGFSLTTFNDELLLFDGSRMYSWQDEEDVWIDRGSAFATINKQTRILNTKIATQANPDVSSVGIMSCYAWEDNRVRPAASQGVRYSIINNSTNTLTVADQLVGAFGSRPRVLQDGHNFYICYCASSQTLFYNVIPVDRSDTVVSQYNVICTDGQAVTTNTTTIPYDAVIFDGYILSAYSSASGVKFNDINNTIIFGITDQPIRTIGMCVDSLGVIWVSFSNPLDTYVCAWKLVAGTLTQVFAPIVINRLVSQASVTLGLIEDTRSLGSCNLTCEVASSGNNNYCNNYLISYRGSPAIPSSTFVGEMRGVGLASKPFSYGQNVFINTVAQSNLQSTYFTQCVTQGLGFESNIASEEAGIASQFATFTIVAKHAPTNGGNYRSNSLLSQCSLVDSSTFVFAGQRKGPFSSWQNAQTVNLGCAGYSIIFDTVDAFNNVSANNNLHIVGGIKKIYDGVSVVEDNFNLFPEMADGYACDITLLGAGSGALTYNPLTVPNQYQYCVCYEWTDNFGQVQRSNPGVASTIVTTAANQGTKLIGQMLRVTEKTTPRSPVIISIFRTQDSLPIFYKITDDNNPLVNDPTVDTWTFTDTLSDMDIAANENLYTGSQLPNNGPPPCSIISLYQQRLMINSTEDAGILWYSQNKFEQDQYNTLALDWNTSFIEGVGSRFSDDITAIGLLDNSLAVFKRDSIFILQGDGPNALDTFGQFNDAQPIVADTGCVNQNSLCFITQTPNSPGGLLFGSPKGIYLLGRDESLTYIGAPVEKYNDLTITSANLLARSNQVVFTTLEGTALVYNYFFNAWTTWPNLPSISATVWNDQLCLLQSDGSVMIQDNTNTIFHDTFTASGDGYDTSYPVSMVATTPWIKFQDMQGYMSVYNCTLLGTLQGPHVLEVQTAYDYNPTITSRAFVNSNAAANRWGALPTWGNQGPWGATDFANYQFQLNFNNPRCESIQLTFSDVNNPTYSQGFSLCGLVLEILPQQGPMRLPTQNKVALS